MGQDSCVNESLPSGCLGPHLLCAWGGVKALLPPLGRGVNYESSHERGGLSCVERGDGVPRILTDIEEKFLEYLVTLKKPVTVKTLAKRFIVSESRASTILKFLHEKGFTDIKMQGNVKLHKFKD